MDASIVIAGLGLVGSLAAVAVTWSNSRNANRNESDKVKVDAWEKHNQEQEERIVGLKGDITDLRTEVALCHQEKDQQRDEMGAQIRAHREEIVVLRERVAVLEKESGR